MGAVSGMRDVTPAFERAAGHRMIVSFEAGPSLMQKVNAGAPADLVTHYSNVIDDLIKQGKVVGSRVDFARAGVGVALGLGVGVLVAVGVLVGEGVDVPVGMGVGVPPLFTQ